MFEFTIFVKIFLVRRKPFFERGKSFRQLCEELELLPAELFVEVRTQVDPLGHEHERVPAADGRPVEEEENSPGLAWVVKKSKTNSL